MLFTKLNKKKQMEINLKEQRTLKSLDKAIFATRRVNQQLRANGITGQLTKALN